MNILSYNVHINNIVARALQRSSTLFRGFALRNLQFTRKAFVTYIRPILRHHHHHRLGLVSTYKIDRRTFHVATNNKINKRIKMTI